MTQNPFQNAMVQLEKVAKLKSFDNNIIYRLSKPDREIRISIPVTMDNGELKIFEGYRVQHNSVLGPYKGGIRYHHDTDISEVKALAFWMSLKCAVIGIPMGGGKGGITVNPKELSERELEILSRGWVQKMVDNIGPKKDVPAPDVNTTPQIMAWMADEYQKITGDTTNAVITGKPVSEGGSLGRATATAQGGFYAFEALKSKFGLDKKCNVAIQGFGNAGANAALIWENAGHSIIAVSDSKGAIFNSSGLDVKKVMEHKKQTGSVVDFIDAKNITDQELLTLDCDLLIPAALENVITGENAENIKANVILELANGPINPEADEILVKNNIPVIPDILANSGGVAVSCFEWEQNLKNENWTEEAVFDKLQSMMRLSADEIYNQSEKYDTNLRMGAFMVAIDRISAGIA